MHLANLSRTLLQQAEERIRTAGSLRAGGASRTQKRRVGFTAFIPDLCGSIGVAHRMFLFPDQANAETLKEVFTEGVFHNKAEAGFQEGFYPRPKEITELFRGCGFEQLDLCSVRSWGYGREDEIYRLEGKDNGAFHTVMNLIEQTAREPAIVEICGHAVYIGQKT